jgi:hypothetical protein
MSNASHHFARIGLAIAIPIAANSALPAMAAGAPGLGKVPFEAAARASDTQVFECRIGDSRPADAISMWAAGIRFHRRGWVQ